MKVEGEITGIKFQPTTPTVSYQSAFALKHLDYAKYGRDQAAEIEAIYTGENVPLVPSKEKQKHSQYVMMAVIHSIAFLDARKLWLYEQVKQNKIDIEMERKPDTEDKGIEDVLVEYLDVCGFDGGRIKDIKSYKKIEALRRFRNDLIHFETKEVKAGEESDRVEELESECFPGNPLGNNIYPFCWFSSEIAEIAVRSSFDLWRKFSRELGKEQELLKGI